MAFSEDVVLQAWQRANGRCECTRSNHGHVGNCSKNLVWGNRGREGYGAWEAHHRVSSGGDGLSNCEILCWSCHKQTF